LKGFLKVGPDWENCTLHKKNKKNPAAQSGPIIIDLPENDPLVHECLAI
jgi:hypothetical protein